MSKLNPTVKGKGALDKDHRVAGGFGVYAARQDAVSLLSRVVMANMLWENIAYVDGENITEQIVNLVPKCPPEAVYRIALRARLEQKLRHTPLFLAVEMCRYPEHAEYVDKLLPEIITRADMLTDFLALYWKRNEKKSISHRAAKGLAEAFHNFDEYQFAKYDRDTEVKLRDVMFLCHPVPRNEAEKELFAKIANRTLDTPDTWEVALSSGADKKESWERLINERRLGGLAFLRNLAGMRSVGVNKKVIKRGFTNLANTRLLPFDFLKAYNKNEEFKRDLEEAMLRAAAGQPKLPGRSLFIVDVSGSMKCQVSSKSELTRLDCAMAMTILASEMCEDCEIVCTAGCDSTRVGDHEWIPYPNRGFDLIEQIKKCNERVGWGGIFTRQCLEWCKENFSENCDFDRIIIFSDSQDCDYPEKRTPKPFGRYNYICDVSCERHGIAYKGVWTAEISGFSENFLHFIHAYEQSLQN